MAERKSDFALPTLDDLFSTQQEREDAKLEKIRDIPLDLIDDFPDHPFHVKDDEDMVQLVESIKSNGVLTPAVLRQKEDGRYELVSGHRRKRACELAGLTTLRSEIKDLTRDEAIVYMVESNFQRTTILPSEKAFAYKMRLEAMNRQGQRSDFYEIPEDEVINAGLITRAIYVNEGVNEKEKFENDYDYLLELADDKRKEIRAAYEFVGTDIRPLVLVQFPVGQPETIAAVQDKLAQMGYTYDNGMVNIWMSDEKMISDDLTKLNGTPAFLLMKQAISTGWDCPRAKILVKLREGGSQDFQIQTIGRIRRMPERKHYIFPATLDFCYLYTLDTQYKEGLLSSLDKAYQVRRLFSKEEVRDFTLTKEMRNLDIDTGIGERELLHRVCVISGFSIRTIL